MSGRVEIITRPERRRIDLDVSTLADWVGASAATLMPLVEAIAEHVFAAERIQVERMRVARPASGAPSTRTPSPFLRLISIVPALRVATAKLFDIEPRAWLADVLARIADQPANRIAELLPWNWKDTKPQARATAA